MELLDGILPAVLGRCRASLDSTSATGGGKTELGPLPSTAVALLAVLAAAWVLILAYVLGRWLRGKRKKNPPA